MAFRRLLTIAFILLLNLVVGFIYMHSWKMTAIISNDNEAVAILNASVSGAVSTNLSSSSSSNITAANASTPSTVVTTSSISQAINPHPYSYLLNTENLCRQTSGGGSFTLLILVCSAVGNFKQRQAIRNTWGFVAQESNNTGSVRLGFLLGSTRNKTLLEMVAEEFAKHSDVIMEDFIDSYKNLTLKSVLLLKWVSEFCSTVHYVLKTDDDMYINVPNLMSVLAKLPQKNSIIFGVLFRKAKPNRNLSAKWYVPRSQFQGNIFPDYLSGTAYTMSRDVTPKLYQASLTSPFLVMEDVFITGICATKVGVRRVNMKGFAHWKRPATGCAFKDTISGHHVSINDMQKIYSELKRTGLRCKVPKRVH